MGAGPLEPLLREPGVTDVLVNGPDQVYIDRGAGLELTDFRFPGESDVGRLAQRLAASVGRRLDEACRQRRRRAPVHRYWIFDQTFAIIDEGPFLLFSPPERMNNPTQALRRLLRDLVAAGDDYKKMRDGRLG